MSYERIPLTYFDRLPDGLLDIPVNRLDTLLPGPSLINIPGEMSPPLFVSVLLHGNEVTGLLAVQQMLREYRHAGQQLPRSVLLFIGNVYAAKFGVRRLAGQPDYNRLWAGGNGPEYDLAQEVLEHLNRTPLFAAVDIHNNTGKNPMYACVNYTDARYINLAREFSSTLVYFTEPHQVLSMALSEFCPAVTLECGQPGEPEGTAHVADFLLRTLARDHLPTELHGEEDIDLFHTVAKILVPEDISIGFGYKSSEYDICFKDDFESLNFRLLPHDSVLGWHYRDNAVLTAIDNANRDVSPLYFHYRDDCIMTRKTFLPSMFTRDIRVIYQDCLGYIMEHYPIYT